MPTRIRRKCVRRLASNFSVSSFSFLEIRTTCFTLTSYDIAQISDQHPTTARVHQVRPAAYAGG
jgi:hypothetical protein